MTWLDGVFLLILLLLSFIGFRKGVVQIVVIISSYLAGIIAAAVLAEPAGEILAGYTKAPEAFSRVIAAIIIFILTALIIRGIGLLLKKAVSAALPGMDKACGLLFGAVLAFILIVLASVFLYISAMDSEAGKLYEESFTPGMIMRGIEKVYAENGDSTL